MAFYESVFIARQDVSGPQVEALADSFTAVIEENGGKVAKRELWGLKNLTYRIKKNRKGHYVMFNLDAPAAAVQEMERQMRLHEDILRYLTVKVDELDDAPSVQARAGRDEERPRRRHESGGDQDRPSRREASADNEPSAKKEGEDA